MVFVGQIAGDACGTETVGEVIDELGDGGGFDAVVAGPESFLCGVYLFDLRGFQLEELYAGAGLDGRDLQLEEFEEMSGVVAGAVGGNLHL